MDKKTLKRYIKESEYRSSVYKTHINEAERTFRQLNSENMQGVLIQFEDFLDSNHMYAFKNWFDGSVWDGPNIKRYWVSMTLKYPYEQMPDPAGGMRLINTGSRVTYKLTTERVPVEAKSQEDLDPATNKPKDETKEIWLVEICVPRRFIQDSIEDEPEIEAPPEEPTEQEEPSLEEDDLENDTGDETGGEGESDEEFVL